MPLAILTIRKELHGFLFLCIRVVPFSIIMGLSLAALWAAGAPLLIILSFVELNSIDLLLRLSSSPLIALLIVSYQRLLSEFLK